MRREPKRVEAQERERKGQRRWTGSGREANKERAEESGSARERERGQRRWTGSGREANEEKAEESGSAREREGQR
eukprot:5392372-Pleurochrysis_carterae.AAC.1